MQETLATIYSNWNVRRLLSHCHKSQRKLPFVCYQLDLLMTLFLRRPMNWMKLKEKKPPDCTLQCWVCSNTTLTSIRILWLLSKLVLYIRTWWKSSLAINLCHLYNWTLNSMHYSVRWLHAWGLIGVHGLMLMSLWWWLYLAFSPIECTNCPQHSWHAASECDNKINIVVLCICNHSLLRGKTVSTIINTCMNIYM